MTLTHAIHSRRRSYGYLLAAGLVIISGCSDNSDQPGGATATSNKENAVVQRTAVNPWPWSIELGFNQGELVTGGSEVLYLAGQSSVDADGAPLHAGDMAAQIALALDNLEAVLAEAGMDLSNVVRLNTYTTDVDGVFQNYGIIAERFGAAGVQPPGSLLGVARLAYPELLVELEATAVR
jgi:enamine deaminase RidA (YjgF/YER057c/UK114 family)